MAELKHTIKYRYVCEHCGKQTDWFTMDIEGEKHHGTLVQQAVQNLAENARTRLDQSPPLCGTSLKLTGTAFNRQTTFLVE
jgi:hypothetical protein